MKDLQILLFIGFIAIIYFLPFIVSLVRGSNRSTQIFLLNLFLGWTFLVWVIALVMAIGKKEKI
ncbi:MAG: superinfection immunity protein [Thermotogota bacterium]|nr:superinfection immunity protein [Thermotogota bacterium]